MSWHFGGVVALGAATVLSGCGDPGRDTAAKAPVAPPAGAASTLAMGGAKSVTTFFVTSKGVGKGGNLGGLAGADAHCQALAQAEYAGDHVWHAYLSTTATATASAVNARDRIGKGPWYNAEGSLVAKDLEELHSGEGAITKSLALTERANPVNGVGDSPNTHDMLTGSRPDGTAYPAEEGKTCSNWTSAEAGTAQVGHHDRKGQGDNASSWNSAHGTRGCSQQALVSTGGAGLFYCFATN